MTDQRASGRALLEQRCGLLAVALGEPDLRQPLQAVRLSRCGVHVAVQVHRLEQLPLRPLEVAHQERGLADQRGGERHPAQGSRPARPGAQLLGELDDLGVGHRPVQQVLGHAEVGVEQGGGEAGPAARTPQLEPEPFEPLAALVRDQTLQRHQVDVVPGVFRGQQRPGGRPPRRPRPRRRRRRSRRGCPGPAGSGRPPRRPRAPDRRAPPQQCRAPRRSTRLVPASHARAGARCRW